MLQNGNIPIQKKGEKFEFDRLYHSMLVSYCISSVEIVNRRRDDAVIDDNPFQSVGFLDETQQRVFSVISAVLLLGNLNFIKVLFLFSAML